MSNVKETFFTVIGCMDGRCQAPLSSYGKKKFKAKFPDTITGPGIVGILAENPPQDFLEDVKKKLMISVEKHRSKGVIVDGHAECAGDPVDDQLHKKHVKKAVTVIKEMIDSSIPVLGVFVHRSTLKPAKWEIEEVA